MLVRGECIRTLLTEVQRTHWGWFQVISMNFLFSYRGCDPGGQVGAGVAGGGAWG